MLGPLLFLNNLAQLCHYHSLIYRGFPCIQANQINERPDTTAKRPDYTGELERLIGNVIKPIKMQYLKNQARIENIAAALLHLNCTASSWKRYMQLSTFPGFPMWTTQHIESWASFFATWEVALYIWMLGIHFIVSQWHGICCIHMGFSFQRWHS